MSDQMDVQFSHLAGWRGANFEFGLAQLCQFGLAQWHNLSRCDAFAFVF